MAAEEWKYLVETYGVLEYGDQERASDALNVNALNGWHPIHFSTSDGVLTVVYQRPSNR